MVDKDPFTCMTKGT